MAQRERPLSPFLHYRWQYTNTLSILHRVTGVFLSLGFFILVYWLASAASGTAHYARALDVLGSLPLQIVLFGTTFAFCYHLLNGIRHLCFDMGVGFDLATARKSAWVTAVGAVVLASTVWFVLRGSLGGAA
jgi:succinate dehydrogenase / fumarate reductase cytochrome b subunit